MFADRTLIPALPASDMERAKMFYLDTFGLKPTEEDAEGARYETGESWFLVYPSAFAGTNQATAAAWEVDDLPDTVTRLKARGVEFQEFELEGMPMVDSIVTAPGGTHAAWMVDSEGNIICLTHRADAQG